MSTTKHVPRFTKTLPVPVLLGLHLSESGNGAFKRKDFFLGRKDGARVCVGLQNTTAGNTYIHEQLV